VVDLWEFLGVIIPSETVGSGVMGRGLPQAIMGRCLGTIGLSWGEFMGMQAKSLAKGNASEK
jgi:hypothetical protein